VGVQCNSDDSKDVDSIFNTVHQLCVDFNRICDSLSREVLYNILTEVDIPMKPVRTSKICLN
jgi:hypothetical protein